MKRRAGASPIMPAEPATGADGTPCSAVFDEAYHRTDDALGQVRHTFLGGNRLPERWRGREAFVIVETGFGLGLNFLATWAAWRDDPQRPARLHFVSVEKFPFRVQDLRHCLEAMLVLPGMTQLAPLVQKLCDVWPGPVAGWHRLEPAPGVVLSVGFGDFFDLMPSLRAGADAFYLDGFTPEKNADLWTPNVFKTLGRLARDGATLATHTAVEAVRRDLIGAGFQVAPRAGHGGKPDVLAGDYAPPYRMRRYDPPTVPPQRAREAIVVGAGMAGAAMVRRLVARGWRVRLFERAQAPGTAASGNPAGVFHPQLSVDDNVLSRLTRAGFLYSLSQWRTLPGGLPGHADGLLQVATDDDQAHALQQLIAAHRYPQTYAKWVDAAQASALAGEILSDRVAFRAVPARACLRPPWPLSAWFVRSVDSWRTRVDVARAQARFRQSTRCNSPPAFAAAIWRSASASTSVSCAPMTAYLPSMRKQGTPVMPMREAVAISV